MRWGHLCRALLAFATLGVFCLGVPFAASAQTSTTAPPAVVVPTVCANQSGFVGAFDPSNLCTVGGEGLQVVTLPGNWDVVARAGTVVPCLKRLVPGQGGTWDGWVGGGPQCQYRPLVAADMWLFTAVGQPAGKLLVYCAFSDQGANNGRVDPALQLIGAGNNCRADSYGLGALYGDPYVVDRFRVIPGVTTEAWEATAFAGGGYVPALDPAPGIWKTGWRIVADPFAGPVDDCQWIAAGGGSYADSVVNLPSATSRVSLVGTRCGVSGLRLTVTTAGSAGSVVTWIGADNSLYSFTAISGRLFFAHADRGVDLGPFVTGLVVELETGSGRVRSQAPGGAMSSWTAEIAGAKVSRDASVPPRLMLFGHPSTSSAGTVLNLGGSNLSTAVPVGTDPTTGQPPGGGAHSGCELISDIGLNPSSWVPGLVGGVECVVGGAVDAALSGIRALFVPTTADWAREISFMNTEFEHAPLQWVRDGGRFISASHIAFSTWADGAPACKTLRWAGEICPRTWGEGVQVPGAPVLVLIGGLWVALIMSVARFL